MKLLKTEMTKETAQEILSWQYEPPYDFYNNETSEAEMAELLNGTYFAVFTEKEKTVGFFCIGKSAQVPAGKLHGAYEAVCIDMGLGMNPGFVGKGNGTEFGLFILNSIEETHPDLPVRLTVAVFNERAIHLYKKLGFAVSTQFDTDTASFVTMIKR